jgi:hypothetical protein
LDFCKSCNLLSYQDCDDIRDLNRKQDVDKALRGADCVFHLASYGMLGKEMLRFVGTYNVVFGGKEIVNGKESLPYLPIDDHVDPYRHSKSVA